MSGWFFLAGEAFSHIIIIVNELLIEYYQSDHGKYDYLLVFFFDSSLLKIGLYGNDICPVGFFDPAKTIDVPF